MKNELPFRHEEETGLINKIHPLVRFILPFILVIPCLLVANIYLIMTNFILIAFISIVFRLHFIQTLSRLKIVIPFALFITFFIPFYYGQEIVFEFNIGLRIYIYREGLLTGLLILLRIILAAFTFLTFFSSLTYSEYIDSLTKIRVIPSFFVGSIVIMLHYIPILANSNKKVLEAQELRGKEMTSYWQRLKTHAYIMGKNVVNNMERSDKLYESLKMRGFTGKITFATRNFRIHDYLIIVISVMVMIFLIYFINLESIYIGVLKLILQ